MNFTRAFRQHYSHIYHIKRNIADARPFAESDLVILRESRNRSAPHIFSRPLKPGAIIQSHRGHIYHNDIIGKRVRDIVTSKLSSKPRRHGTRPENKQATDFRLHEVKLEEYVRFTKRLVTPVYPADAALIVDLLDLHPGTLVQQDNQIEGDHARLEILEAGTGHGALTLYLSRAIHPANAQGPPPVPNNTNESHVTNFKQNRRAIIHTIEQKEKYSWHAREVVSGFKHGLYASNVDFYVSDVGKWVRSEFADRGSQPFLSHAVLDMPNADAHLADVAAALRVDGTLIVFNPSLTQILTCCAKAREEGLLLELEKVVELPSGGGSAGREWDVRAVRPRSTLKGTTAEATTGVDASPQGAKHDGESAGVNNVLDEDPSPAEDCATDAELSDDGTEQSADREAQATDSATPVEDGGWQMVCRPKVGDRIVGGGFLGVFKKQRDMRDSSPAQ
jgi:tRNA A58 N-methylase Trm61